MNLHIKNIFFFSIFSSLTIIWNFVLMTSWVPAWMILHHKLLVIKLSGKLPNIPKNLGESFSNIKSTDSPLFLFFLKIVLRI